jgi:hypothetical protein
VFSWYFTSLDHEYNSSPNCISFDFTLKSSKTTRSKTCVRGRQIKATLLRKLELRINIPHASISLTCITLCNCVYSFVYYAFWQAKVHLIRGGQRGISSRNHEDHFSRVTKNKISFSRFLETQKRNKVWNYLTIF